MREYKNRIRKKTVKSKSDPPGLIRKMSTALPLASFSERQEEEDKSKEARNRWKVGIKKVVNDVQKNAPSKKETWQRLIEKVLEENQKTEDDVQDKCTSESEESCFNIFSPLYPITHSSHTWF